MPFADGRRACHVFGLREILGSSTPSIRNRALPRQSVSFPSLAHQNGRPAPASHLRACMLTLQGAPHHHPGRRYRFPRLWPRLRRSLETSRRITEICPGQRKERQWKDIRLFRPDPRRSLQDSERRATQGRKDRYGERHGPIQEAFRPQRPEAWRQFLPTK